MKDKISNASEDIKSNTQLPLGAWKLTQDICSKSICNNVN